MTSTFDKTDLSLLAKLREMDIQIYLDEGQLKINAPKGTLTPELINEIKTHKAGILCFLENSVKKEQYSSIKPTEKKEYYPQSSVQRRLFVLQQMMPKSTAYNMPQTIELPEIPSEDVLRNCYEKLIKRHDSFRTYFVVIDEEPVQRIADHIEFEIQKYSPTVPAKKILETFIRPFDLSKAPLLRAALLITSQSKAILLVDMHHIISDGVSQNLLVKDFKSLYRGETLEPLKLQYKDYSEWHRNTQESLKEQEEYWLKKISDNPPPLNLPHDFPRLKVHNFEGNTLEFQIPPTVTSTLKDMAKASNSTLYMVLLTQLNILLSKLSGQEDILIGTPTAGRKHNNLEQIIGMFVNTLVLRNFPKEEISFHDFMEEVKNNTITAFEHQEYPFEELVKNVLQDRDERRNPLFDVMYSLQTLNSEINELKTGEGTSLQLNNILKNRTSKFDIGFHVTEFQNKLMFSVEYSTQLFKEESIQRFIDYFKVIIDVTIKNPGIKFKDIEILSPEERKQILYDFNNTTTPYPNQKSIDQLFQEQLQRTPDHIALIQPLDKQYAEIHSISFKQLDAQVETLAYILQSEGTGTHDITAIMADRSIEMVVAILAILRAGSAYLPINPEYPAPRINYMLADSATNLLLTQGQVAAEKKQELSWNKKHIELEALPKSPNPVKKRHQTTGSSESPAYIMYTSGTTGNPKAVIVGQKSVVRLVKNTNFVEFKPHHNLLQTGALDFDASTFEIWGTLLNGLTLHLVSKDTILSPNKFKSYTHKHHIDTIWLTGALFNHFVDAMTGIFEPLSNLLIGGDKLSAPHVNKIRSIYPTLRVINGYGPTENTTFSCTYPIKEDYKENIPIGSPISNSTAYIVDKFNRPVPMLVAGELLVGGDGMGHGYLNNPELSVEKFITLNIDKDNSIKVYRTGDLARWLPGGNIDFLGRIDLQVKIRGFRIETGEIEHCLSSHPSVVSTAVISGERQEGEKFLCAYIVPSKFQEEEEATLAQSLRHFLSGKLPAYMMPDYFVFLESFPLNANGKLDRKALPQPESRAGENYVPPQNEIEKQLTELWSPLLAMDSDNIGVYDNFFHLGGHSLKAVQLMSRIHKAFSVEIPISVIFKNPNIKGLAQYIENAVSVNYSQITPLEKNDYYELSSAQSRLYILHQMAPEGTGYNMPGILKLTGCLEKEQLDRTFQTLLARHESFRTSFSMIDGTPVQIIHENPPFQIEIIHSQPDKKRLINNFIRPFDLTQVPLLRVGLTTIEPEKHLLMFDMHHIISDGTSMGILVKEFVSIYKNEALTPLPIQYKDFAAWQRGDQNKDNLKIQKSYWLNEFVDEIPVLNLPTDYPRPAMQSFRGDSIKFKIDARTTKALEAMAKSEGQTLFMILLAAFNVFLARMSGQDEILVGTPVAGRRHADLESIIGFFINTLPIKSNPTGQKSIGEFIKETGEKSVSALANQDMQYEELVESLDVERDAGRNPLFDVMFVFQNMDSSELMIPGLEITPLSFETRISKFDLLLAAIETGDTLSLTLEYSTDLLEEATIQRFIVYFKKILSAFTKDQTKTLGAIDILPQWEKHQLIHDFNNTTTPYPNQKSIDQLFQEQLQRTPDHIALIQPLDKQYAEIHSISYKQLDTQVETLAYILQSEGTGTHDITAIMADRSIEMVVAILAILRAGSAYLPINPEYPAPRINYMLADSATNLLLTQGQVAAEKKQELSWNKKHIELEALPKSPNPVKKRHQITGSSESPAYIMYTSGTTGNPKAVIVGQKSVVRLVKNTNFVEFKPHHNLLQTGALDFDASTFEIWGTLLNGLTLHLVSKDTILSPNKFKSYTHKHHIDTIWLTGALFNHFVDAMTGIFEPLSNLLIGGDKLSAPHVNKIRSIYPTLRVINGYGPTENTTFSCTYPIKKDYKENIPIGSPISNSTAYIVDKFNRPVPMLVAGELLVGGDGMGHGYLNNPELSVEKFITLNIDKDNSIKVYRTGDLARWLPGGNIDFLGRIDLQVKIRGFRIETGEIEHCLSSHPNVVSTAVISGERQEGEKFLCSYIVPSKFQEEEEATLAQSLRHFLSGKLPAYMMPDYFVFLESFPLNANGKLDRKALPQPESRAGDNYVPPQNEIEKQLTELWSPLLAMDSDNIGIYDNFFHLGGHSLKAVQLMSRIHKAFLVEIPISVIFKNPNIKGLAQYIENAVSVNYSQITPLEKNDYYELSSAQSRLYILHQMAPEGTGYNMPGILKLTGCLEKEQLDRTFQTLLARHESFRTSFSMIDGTPVQIIHENPPFQIEIIHSQPDKKRLINNFIRPFDLTQVPLLRVGLTTIEPEKHLLMFDMHHIISDGTSMGILVKEFVSIYKNEALTPLPIQYKDFAAWQRGDQNKDNLKIQKSYWLNEFVDEIPVLNLPTDYPRPAMQSFRGDSIKFQIDARTTKALEAIAKSEGQTLFMILLAAFNVFLARMSGQDEILVGTPVAGRRHTDLESIIGFFINTLPIKSNPTGQKSIGEFIKETGDKSLSALANQDMQYEELVESLDVERDAGRNPLFDVMFVFQNMDSSELMIPGLEITPLSFETRISKFDLLLAAIETGDTLSLTLEYSTDLLEEATIQRFIVYFKKILSAFTKDQTKTLGAIDILPQSEKHQLIHDFNNTTSPYPNQKSIDQLFQEQLQRTPDHIALIQPLDKQYAEIHSISYKRLDAQVETLAYILQSEGTGAHDITAIMADRSIEMVVAILAILRAGSAYLPINPEYPAPRINYMLADSATNLLLTQGQVAAEKKQELSWNKKHIELEALPKSPNPVKKRHQTTGSSESPAYIMYTSGTTGNPKAVIVGQKSVVRLVKNTNFVEFKPHHNLLQTGALDFDASTFEIWGTLLNGLTLHLVSKDTILSPNKFKSYTHKHHIDTIWLTGALFNHFVDAMTGIFEPLSNLLIGGDKLSAPHVNKIRSIYPTLRVINGYGPTENTTFSCTYPIKEDYKENIPIGSPISNSTAYIVDKFNRPVPMLVAGELLVGGDGMGHGYLNNPELSVEKFITLNIDKNNSIKVYRTGDLARWLPSGNIDFLGRIDLQVKIRGFRIETGEIEHCLSSHPNVVSTAVISGERQEGEKFLCAYIVPSKFQEEEEATLAQSLRHFLSGKLPTYMMPDYFVFLESFPLNANGKLDRKALPQPESRAGENYVPPQNEIEKQLTELWSPLLAMDSDNIGVYDNFFHLGGHSLKAVQLMSRIHKAFSVEIPISVIFKNPNIKGLAQYIENAVSVNYSQITPLEKNDYYELSSAQSRLYILHQMAPEGTGYNMPGILKLTGCLEKEQLDRTFQTLLARHESFRTSFSMIDGTPVQIIHENPPFQIEIIHSQPDKKRLINNFIRPFDLTQVPLLRVGLTTIEPEKHLLMFDMHHIISDGTSMGILVKEFVSIYKNEALTPLPIQYKDFAAWQRGDQNKDNLKIQKSYWLNEFVDEIPVLNLPTDYPRPAMQSFRGDSIKFKIDARTTKALEAMAKSEGQTLFMILLAAFNVFLARMSGQDEILVGTPVAGRRHADLESIIGFFINTLPIKSNPTGQKSIGEFIKETGEKSVSALANQDMQYEELVESLDVERDAGRNPLFDVMFVFQNMDSSELIIPGLKITPLSFETRISKFDLLLAAIETGDTLSLTLEYSTDLFEEATIHRFIVYFKKILSAFIKDQTKTLGAIDILPQWEKHQLIHDFNNTTTPYPNQKSIDQLFQEQLQRTPDHIALIQPLDKQYAEIHSISYKQLDTQVETLAYILQSEGTGTHDITAIMADRSIEMVVAILAILRAGSAYLPINPEYPAPRINYMLADSATNLLLTQGQVAAEKKQELSWNKKHIELEALPKSPNPVKKRHQITGSSESPAYIMYTSGTTGNPKAVIVGQKSVVRLVKNTNFVEFKPHHNLLQTGALDFDASTFEIWGTLLNGLTLHLVSKDTILSPNKFKSYTHKHHIDTIWLTGALFNHFVDAMTGIFEPLSNLLIGGDKLSAPHVNKIRSIYPTLRVINGYGPTENTTFSCTYPIKKDYKENIPIGSPISNSTAYIVDKFNRPVPMLVAGELLVGGDGMGHGYLNNPELSVEKFITLNIDKDNSIKVYRTGDLARWLPGGNIDFLGRIDLQVKIRGFRIETGEIEHCLSSHPNVVSTAVISGERQEGEKFLCSYIVPSKFQEEEEATLAQSLRHFLSGKLPAYMMPDYFVFLESFPLNANGKLDRKALPQPESRAGDNYVPPQNEIEKQLTELWSPLLAMDSDNIGIYDNFFHLGGHSLKAVQLMSRIHKAFLVEIPISVIFKNPNIKGLAQYIENAVSVNYSQITPLEKNDYYELSSAQSRLYILHQMAPEGTGYNMPGILKLTGCLEKEQLDRTFQTLLARHESFRTSFSMIDGTPVQIIHENPPFQIEIIHSQPDKKRLINNFIRPFDLTQVPLLRVGLTTIEPEKHLLMFDMHHIISDGTSMGILVKEFVSIYKNEALTPLPIQYKDFAAWQRGDQNKDNLKIQKSYWLNEFVDEIPVLNLPTDYPRPAMQSFRGDSIKFQIDARTTKALEAIAKSEGQTLFMILLAAFNVFLARMSGQDEILVGTPVAGRRHTDLESIIGFFINTLPIKSNPTGQKSIGEFIKETGDKSLSALANQDMQYEELVESLDVERDAGRNPLFDVMFVFQNMDSSELMIPGLEITPLSFETRISKFDLLLAAIETGDTLSLTLEYSTDLLEEATIQRFIVYFKKILSAFTKDQTKTLGAIDILPQSEKHQLIHDFNNTTSPYPNQKSIDQLFQEQLQRTPDHIALIQPLDKQYAEIHSISYKRLDAQVETLAYILQSEGTGAHDITAIMADRSIEMVVAILAILRAGSAYLPINPEYPAPRINYMLADSATNLLLTQGQVAAEKKQELSWNKKHIELEALPKSPNPVKKRHQTTGSSESPAYIMYTSGTTGNPKAVIVGQKSVVRLVKNTNFVEFKPHHNLLQTGALDFDASTFEIWGTLLNGLTLHLVSKDTILSPNKFKSYTHKHHIDTIWLTGALFNHFVDAMTGIFEPLSNLLIGGDKLSAPHVNKIRSIYPTLRVINGYGPTENTTFSCTYPIKEDYKENIPIGSPISNSTAYIVDKFNRPVPMLVAGELLVGGDGMGHGYLNNPELSVEKFITLNIDKNNSIKVYRTGDLARWLPSGNIDFLGRIDLQVKIRGFRIETGEIEHCLSSHPNVVSTAVISGERQEGEKFLCAYIVPSKFQEEEEATLAQSLRHFLSGKLPAYMMPDYFVFLESFPLNANGKLDRKALPQPESRAGDNYVPPQNEIEKQLTELWSPLLAMDSDNIGVYDNFFHLGGHSLKAVQLMSRIHKAFSVEIPISVIFKNPNIKGLAQYIENAVSVNYSQITPLEKNDYYELSSAQSRLYILHQMAPEGTGYNMPAAIKIKGKLKKDRVNEVFLTLIERHDSFRTSFSMLEDRPVQKILNKVAFQIEDLTIESTENVLKNFIQPFELSNAPLLRVGLLKINSEEHILALDMHHIISDGTSMGILVREFTSFYKGEILPPLHVQYKDFAAWQRGDQNEDNLKIQKSYWLNEFVDEIPVLNLPTDYARPSIQTFRGHSAVFEIDARTTKALEAIAKSEGQTLFMILFAAFNVFLARMSGQDEIVVGTPVAGRRHTDLESIIGFFINTLPIKSNPTGQKSIGEFIKEMGDKSVSALANQDVQYEELVENLDVERDAGRNPLFDVMFIFQNMDIGGLDIPGLNISPVTFDTNISKFDLLLSAKNAGELLGFVLEYSTDLFEEATIHRFIVYFKRILSAFISDQTKTLGAIDILPQSEKHQLLYEYNNTDTRYPNDKTIYQLIQEQEAKTPHSIAIAEENSNSTSHFSYREFNNKTNQLAWKLVQQGVVTNTAIGVMAERSLETIIAIISIIKAGGVYLPIDPEYPPKRIERMMTHAGAKYLLTPGCGANQPHSEALKRIPGLNIMDTTRLITEGKSLPVQNLEGKCGPGDLIYIVFTSGSTGIPKGAGVYHRSFTNLLHWFVSKFNMGEKDSNLLMTSLSFDLTQKNFYAPLIIGGTLNISKEHHFDPQQLLTRIRKQKISWINCTPSMFTRLVEFGETNQYEDLSSLTHIFLGGEPIVISALSHYLFSENCKGKIINTYGPTECTDISNFYCIDDPSLFIERAVPLGGAINNVKLYVLDKNLALLPTGLPGELFIGGDSIGIGYINDSELTNQKFVTLTFESDKPAQRLYGTGDLVKSLVGGDIEFIGRIDHQVKVRGFRIELGEIENRILNHPSINETVVMARQRNQRADDTYLCAYIVPNSGSIIETEELASYLAQELPAYMVPDYFVSLEIFPLNPNGKIDRKALPEPTLETSKSFSAPRNKIEVQLAEIWSEVLVIDKKRVGIDDNFFELGGHSLKATGMVSKIHKALEVKIQLPLIFNFPTIRQLAIQVSNSLKQEFIPLSQGEEKEYYPLSFSQKRLFILYQLNPQSTGYNMPGIYDIEGNLNWTQFENAFIQLVNRHESFRTSFHMIGEEPVQKIHKEALLDIKYHDISNQSQPVENDVTSKLKEPFDLTAPPLLRVNCLKKSENTHIFMIDMHHIISDAISMSILISEFMELISGKALSPLKFQYRNFIEWQNSKLQSAIIKKQEDYWLKEMEGDIPALELPTDFPRMAVDYYTGGNLGFTMGKEIKAKLMNLTQETGTTLFIILQALLNVLLAKLSGQDDIIVGTPVAGRNHSELEGIIGIFINTVVLRNQPSPNKNFKEYLLEVRNKSLDAFENQDYPYEELVANTMTTRDLNRNSLFDVFFNLHNMETKKFHLPGLTLSPYKFERDTAKFDLSWTAMEHKDFLRFVVNYSKNLFKEETIVRFISYFERITESVLQNCNQKIVDIDIIGDEERHQLLYKFNNSLQSYPEQKTIISLFEEHAVSTPDNVSLLGKASILTDEAKMEWTVALSYKELNERANQLGQSLKAKGINSNTVVGLMATPRLETIIGILAVLKAGGIYLPIDPNFDEKRVFYMLKDSCTQILLTTRNLSIPFDGTTIAIDSTEPFEGSRANPNFDRSPLDGIYIIYTSGTTGKPKGTLLNNRNLVNYVRWFTGKAGINNQDRGILTSSSAFDLGYTVTYPTLLSGAQLHIISRDTYLSPERLLNYINSQGVTFMKLTPSLFNTVVESSQFNGTTCRSLRLVVLGGEAIKTKDVEKAYNIIEHLQIMNHYGPTEATIGCVAHLIDRSNLDDYLQRPTIGFPINNMKAFILDSGLKLVVTGAAGELCLSGIDLAQGYINQPDLTADKFVEHPYLEGEQLYRTGDLVRWLNDGRIEFLGRIDSQVKIRGYRVELGEIEYHLSTHKDIQEAVVILRHTPGGDQYLCAYIVQRNGTRSDNPVSHKSYLSERLPDYMVPPYYVEVESIPLTANGKLNRSLLPEPEIKMSSGYFPPQNSTQKKLAFIWKEVLDINAKIGIDDNFFELGGHSLKAIILLSRIHKELAINIPMTEIFNSPTIRSLSKYIESNEKSFFIDIEVVEDKEYYDLSSAQTRIYFLCQMNQENTSYNMPFGVELVGNVEKQRLENVFHTLIRRHESFRTTFEIVEGNPVQRIHNHVKFEMKYFELEPNSNESPENCLRQFVLPFDLTKAPLLRVTAIKLGETKHLLMIDKHHIICDGMSEHVLLEEMATLYNGKNPTELKYRYRDYSIWQKRLKESELMKSIEAYWLNKFAIMPTVLDLPTDFERPVVRGFESKTLHYLLDTEVIKKAEKIMEETHSTMYMFLLASYTILLSLYSGRKEDIVVGSPVMGRKHLGLESLVGMFVNMLSMRNYPVADKTFRNYLNEVRINTIKNIDNQDYQFDDLVEKLGIKRDAGRNPLVDVVFTLQNVKGLAQTNPMELVVKPHPLVNPGATFDLTLDARHAENGVTLWWRYSTELFKHSTIEKMNKHLLEIIEQVSGDQDIKLGAISLSQIFHNPNQYFKTKMKEILDFNKN